ncbi:hypothetical protein D9757_004900 [Collybiopsis confluens]|uniref:Uncharacterized protein n=1 Tax=Collybiopsis confluens TaxID=2823264 RepID=A0A8H5HTP4_9AGAR|nr:hypothetical protein D9757_004900 [Collybiopsis confluens]
MTALYWASLVILQAFSFLGFMVSMVFTSYRGHSALRVVGYLALDIIGNIQCDSLSGQRTATKNGDTSEQSYCYEMKVIQAFSWMIFVLCSFAFIILLQLITQAQRFGRWNIWNEPIRELGWYGEYPGYYNTTTQPVVQYPQYPQYGYPAQAGNGIVQQPGHSIVIQPSVNGAPTVTQIPL